MLDTDKHPRKSQITTRMLNVGEDQSAIPFYPSFAMKHDKGQMVEMLALGDQKPRKSRNIIQRE